MDLMVLALCLLAFAAYYFSPQSYAETDTASGDSVTGVVTGVEPGPSEEPAVTDVGDFTMKFKDKFTDGESSRRKTATRVRIST
ncbi:MAG TPA: hypothetical protein VLN47_02900 [Clostridiaceae bacterium]|nr:hypothetical protein [Clostridiaceae bacterium]